MSTNGVPDDSTGATPTDDDLLACVGAAVAAPSLHNSQPWRFRLIDHAGGVDLFADRHRQLEVIDPSGRELLISVGAALFNLRIALRHRGWLPHTDLFPDPQQPDLVARVTPGTAGVPTAGVVALAEAVGRRHTNRWPFTSAAVPKDVLESLCQAAGHEGAELAVASAVARNAIVSLARSAQQRHREDGAYLAELAQWTAPRRGRREGVPRAAIGPWDALETLPMRDFGLVTPRWNRPAERFEPFPTILVLSTDGDTPRHWVAAGQALQRVLLLATVHHLATTPISQPLEIPAIRELLADRRRGKVAQLIVRVGYGPPAAATPRRPVAQMLVRD
ncbi:nitroreductase family protein [Solwaraspora sp. WMMD791]|uniref:Acg family FMN-binding oxidoreductase n=1 Tax=Solwaraspora sp. WMMD791 TaxID=3016086 RepID=UPI00249B70E2|nr:nitroreductase family protein [Solwaraspora sp. WMMD791]WFE29753.1 nitroreductase family protein [Solwaraspora sp. WMMD791]